MKQVFVSWIIFHLNNFPCLHNLCQPYLLSHIIWPYPLCHSIPHPPPHPYPPTTPPFYSVFYFYGSSNTTSITFPFFLYFLSYQMSDLFSRITYCCPTSNISSYRILSWILILDVSLGIVLQNHLITLINVPLTQILINKIMTFLLPPTPPADFQRCHLPMTY